jgi:hypothetical protein
VCNSIFDSIDGNVTSATLVPLCVVKDQDAFLPWFLAAAQLGDPSSFKNMYI